MTGFDLPANFIHNPKQLLHRHVHQKTMASTSTSSCSNLFATSEISTTQKMAAEKTIREFFTPSSNNIQVGREVNGGEDFELKPGVIHMAQVIPFCGLPAENANNHLHQFLEICSTFTIKGASPDVIRLCLFPFSLLGKAKQWFYANREMVNWSACANAFLAKSFHWGRLVH